MTVRFWGVRGSLPTPGPGTVKYGGNTICVEVQCGPYPLMLDAGSGARGFGKAIGETGAAPDMDILLSHTHLDHICGLPFFAPLFDARTQCRFWGGHTTPPFGIRDALMLGWQAPLMPDIDRAFRANMTFRDFTPGQTLTLHPGLEVGTIMLRHPGNAVGYRIAWGGASICYITDTEHVSGGIDTSLVRFVAGTDLLIYDASYTSEEYKTRVGWGHSTWEAAANIADAAEVRKLVLFHHEPSHDDETMDAIAGAIEARRPGSVVAAEGMTLTVDAARPGSAPSR